VRIYLDACSLQRPLDDRARPRINVEAEAVLTILRLVESGDLDLLSSEALQFEIAKIPDARRRARAVNCWTRRAEAGWGNGGKCAILGSFPEGVRSPTEIVLGKF
jgi:hypothetical protein